MVKYAGWIPNPNPQGTATVIEYGGDIGSYIDATYYDVNATLVNYYDADLHKTKLAVSQGATWNVDIIPFTSTGFGQFSAMALSDEKRLGISFLDDEVDSLVYATTMNPLGYIPVVSQVSATQRAFPSMLLEISYNLEHPLGLPTTITFQISSNGGTTWDVPVVNVSGDIGPNIISGSNKAIIWNAGIDWPDMQSDNMKVRITADDGQ